MRSGACLSPSAFATSFIAAERVPMSLMRLILLRCNAWLAFSFARSISAFFSPRLAVRIITAAPRRSDSHVSSSPRRAGSTGTITSRGTGAMGASRSAPHRPRPNTPAR